MRACMHRYMHTYMHARYLQKKQFEVGFGPATIVFVASPTPSFVHIHTRKESKYTYKVLPDV